MIVIFDGNNMTARASSVDSGLARKKDGIPTGVVYISLKMLKSSVENLSPSKVYVAWDRGRSKARKDLYPEYKATRDVNLTPEEKLSKEMYYAQIDRLKKYLDNLPVVQLEYHYTEADDIIGYLVKHAKELGNEDVCVVSTDEDFLQLIPLGVKIYNPIKEKYITSEDVKEKFKITSSNFIYYKSMVGDSSDNIKGVKGFGAAAAVSLLDEEVKELKELKVRAEKFTKKKKYKDFIENFSIIERNYKIINLLDLSDFLSEETKNSIKEKLVIIPKKADQTTIMRLAFDDEMSSIYNQSLNFVSVFNKVWRL